MALTASVEDIIKGDSNGLLGKHADWERFRLADVAVVQNGAPYASSLFNGHGEGMPLLRIRDVQSSSTEAFYVGDYTDSEVVAPGDLVIGMDGDFKHALWAGPPALLNQRVCRVRFISDAVNPRFVFHLLGGYLDAVNEATPSVTVKHLSAKTVEDLLLPLPPRLEQDRIVGAMDALLAQIESGVSDVLVAQRALSEMRTSVLSAAVGGRLLSAQERDTDDGTKLLREVLAARKMRWEEAAEEAFAAKGKTPASDSWKSRYPEPLVPTPLPGMQLPDGWTWATLDQLATRVQYGSSAKTTGDAGGVPVLRMGNIHLGQLRLDDLKFLPTDHGEFPSLLLEDGDLLFNRTNSPELVGKSAVWRSQFPKASFASYLIRVSLLDGVVPEYISIFLTSTYGRQWVRSVVSQQVGQANVNGSKLRALTVPFPTTAIQHAIVVAAEGAAAAVRETHDDCAGALEAAHAIRIGVLRRAVRGELVGQDLSDEPASQLLARIMDEAEQRRNAARMTKKPRALRAGR